MDRRATISLCLALVVTLLIARPVALAQGDEPAASAEDTPGVMATDQETDGSMVFVDSVVANENGWMVVHADNNGSPGAVLGRTAVPAGITENVIVVLDDPLTGSATVWAMLHVDRGVAGTYEFPDGPDVPATDGATILMVSFVASVPLSGAAMEEEPAADAMEAEPAEAAVVEGGTEMAADEEPADDVMEEEPAEAAVVEDGTEMAAEEEPTDEVMEAEPAEAAVAEDGTEMAAEEEPADEAMEAEPAEEVTAAESAEKDMEVGMAEEMPAPTQLPGTGSQSTRTTTNVAVALVAVVTLTGVVAVRRRRKV